MNASEKNIKRYFQERSLTLQVVCKQGRTALNPSKAPTALPLEWVFNKSFCIEQYPLTSETLQTLH